MICPQVSPSPLGWPFKGINANHTDCIYCTVSESVSPVRQCPSDDDGILVESATESDCIHIVILSFAAAAADADDRCMAGPSFTAIPSRPNKAACLVINVCVT